MRPAILDLEYDNLIAWRLAAHSRALPAQHTAEHHAQYNTINIHNITTRTPMSLLLSSSFDAVGREKNISIFRKSVGR